MSEPRPAAPRLRDILLALIEMHPGVTGYDLQSIIESNVGLFFSTTISQIYPALADLRHDGLIEYREEATAGGRAKKCYLITTAGQRALGEFFATPVTYGSAYRDFGHVVLLCILLPYASDDTIHDRLTEARNFYAAALDRVAGRRALDRETRFAQLEGHRWTRYFEMWDPVMDFLISDYELKVAWLEKVLAACPSTTGLDGSGTPEAMPGAVG